MIVQNSAVQRGQW